MGKHLTARLLANCTNYIRDMGGPKIGALLQSASCFQPSSLEMLWEDDDEKFDVYYKAYRALRSLEDALCRRSSRTYSVPDERTFSTLKVLTENMADLLAQSFVLDTPKYPSSVIYVGLANLTVNLLPDSDLDGCILLGFIVELAISLGESPVLIRALEGMTKSERSKETVLEVITAHATGRMLQLTVVEYEECDV